MLYSIGSKGAMVAQIQRALAGAGLPVIVDSVYGPITRDAVMEFQRRNHIGVDGIVGPATLALLIPFRLKRSRRIIREIIVHCTDTPEGRPHTVADIRLWHTLPVSEGGRGWSDIGYHYVVYLDGTIHEGRDVGKIGAHCAIDGHNNYSIGVVYVGGRTKDMKNFKDTRTELQKNALLRLMMDLRRLYPQAKIYGHHDFDPGKQCPCFDAKTAYKHV